MPPTEVEVPSSAAEKPKPNPHNNQAMFNIFHNVQYNVVQHKKYVKEMTKLYKKLEEESFRESFKNALLYLFTFGDTSANVDRVINFVATFCTSLDEDEEFLLFIFEIIFACQCASGQAVRYRASQLLAAVLSAMGDEASLDDALCEKLLESQMQRLQDTRGAVRCRAALSLQRLQNPMDPDDPVTRAYRFHMSCDSSSSVRRAIVMTIAKCVRNVPFVLERLRDVDEAVRRAAFLYISTINVTQMRVRQRVLTLKLGLTQRSDRVRRVVEEILIPGWLAIFQGNIVDLLKSVRLDNMNDAKDSQFVAGKLLESLFKRIPLSELLEWLPTEKTLRLIPAEKLNKETAWYWRHLAEHLQRTDDDETLETILPDLVVLTGYIKAIVESPCPSESANPVAFSTRQYVLQELGAMLRVYDVSDPASRRALHDLILDVLTGDYGPLSADVIREFVTALELAEPDVSRRIEMVSGVITSLRDPPEPDELVPQVVDSAETKLQRAKLRVSLNVAMEAQEEAVREQNYAHAAECKEKVEKLQKAIEELEKQFAPPPPQVIAPKKTDAETLKKCLIILNCALDTPQLKTITPMLKMIFSELEVEILENPDVLETALETIALFGFLDKEFVMQHKTFLFANLIDTSNESVVSTVLRCIVDLLCVHGPKIFELGADSNTMGEDTTRGASTNISNDVSLSSESAFPIMPIDNTVIEILLKIMDSACPAYRQIIVEGLCRLLFLGELESPPIISRLLLLWFNPATYEEEMLRQIIGVFLQSFPVYVDGAQEQIQKATIPTLKTLARAPSSSPLADIDQEAVVRFIVSLTRVNHELGDSQGGMAEVLVGYLARRPAAPEAGLVCRTLALLAPPRDAGVATALAAALWDLCAKLPDKQSCRNLTRYLGALEAVERASLNKMSHTGITEGTIQEDSLAPLGRMTSSLPQPIARSTHVVINDTVQEEPEIDETSPTEVISRISEENPEQRPGASSPVSGRTSSETEPGAGPHPTDSASNSSDVSPVNIEKTTRGRKKKLSLIRKASKSDSDKPTKSKTKPSKGKTREVDKDAETSPTIEEEPLEEGDKDKGGLKRTRSQRSLVDVDIASQEKADTAQAEINEPKRQKNERKKPSPAPTLPADLDVSNVTVRKSYKSQSESGSDASSKEVKGKGKKPAAVKKTKKAAPKAAAKKRGSAGSDRSSADSYQPFDDSDDTLHTIVYEKDFVQSVLNDSDEPENSKSVSKNNITIPETPEPSDESEPEPSPEPKSRGKRNGKKK